MSDQLPAAAALQRESAAAYPTEIPILYFITNMFESVVGAGLYDLLSSPSFSGVLKGFGRTPLNIAGMEDPRTLILQLFVYISLLFTLSTIPFIEMLRRELEQRGIRIRLGDGS